ncbi:hypothetical protein [Streptomyces sp. NPDC001621]|uniref:hypothetical protein n=1 Tax=Streptomyces sp. NPDC001621 TaxID=3364594 RepID=UPI003674CA30
MNLRKRLHVAVNEKPGDRRQPQVAHLIDQRALQERITEQRRIAAGEALYAELSVAAWTLLELYQAGEILEDPDDDGFWWSELAKAVDDRQDARERANLVTYVRGAVRETQAYARRTGKPSATTERAREAVEAAAELVDLSNES